VPEADVAAYSKEYFYGAASAGHSFILKAVSPPGQSPDGLTGLCGSLSMPGPMERLPANGMRQKDYIWIKSNRMPAADVDLKAVVTRPIPLPSDGQ